MSTLVKSQLNPLANTFIPTNDLNVFRNKRILELIEAENQCNKALGKRDSNELDSESKISKEIAAKFDNYKDFVSKDAFFFSKITSISMGLKNIEDQKSCMRDSFLRPIVECSTDYRRVQQKSYEEAKLYLLKNYSLAVKCSKDSDRRLVQKSSATITITPKIGAIKGILNEENECVCPPMFGWIVPPNFIGNPFNFKYACSKKYPHSPDTDMNRWTLDQCYSEMQDIVTDVIDSISVDSDSIAEWDEECKIEDYLEVSDTEMEDTENNEIEENETNNFGLDFESRASESELIDDGIHPLLQSAPTSEEDDEDLVETVEKILEKSLSPLPESHDTVTFYQRAVGHLCSREPCSQWCDCLPSAVKETYKSILKSVNEKYCNKFCHRRQPFVHRPAFKRSFSADDAPMYDRLSEAAAVEYRNGWRRKDPLNYFKSSSYSLINGRKHGSCDLTDRQLYTNSNEKSSMWGKFGGDDSLWEPLPDCVPQDVNLKPRILKRGRETKLQKTG